MATVEHCLFCFETLSATLEKRSPLTLSQVQALWEEYRKTTEEEDQEDQETEASSSTPGGPLRNPAVQRLSDSSPSGSSTPSSSSSSSLEPSTTVTTPASSTNSISSKLSNELTEYPLFVTWNTVSPRTHEHSLRGCIGTFEALPLATGLSSYALTSALDDHRFSPISQRELPSLDVSVTLLTDFETAKDAMDWELGVHGIRISFYARNRRYGACYLPDVAPEQGWTKEETIVSLMRKAGWSGRKEKWGEVSDLKVVRFQGLAESLGYEEFRKWREWVESRK